jgi:hypothetical protein
MISSGVTTSTKPELHGTSVSDPGMDAARASLTSASGLVLERRESGAFRLPRDAPLPLAVMPRTSVASAGTAAGGVMGGGKATLFLDVFFLATPDAQVATAQERRVALHEQAARQFVATM